MLEVAGVLHAREGNVLDLGDRLVLVEEACSGVRSFFAVLACTLFWSAWTRRPAGHALLLLPAAAAWVLAGNVARIVAVATLEGVGGVTLSSGWGHQALGFCVFAAVLGLIWSTDHLLLLLTPLTRIPWRQVWRDVTTPPWEQEPDDVGERTPPVPPPAAATAPGPTRLPPVAATALGAWPVLACYALLVVAEAGAVGSRIGGGSLALLAPVALPADTVRALEALGEDALPQEFGAWKRAGFEAKENGDGHPIGRSCRTWRYRSGDRSATAAVFYPYPRWKDVQECYAALGWTVRDRVVRDAGPAGKPGPYVTARLYQSRKSHGYLMFQNRDASGRPLPPPAGGFTGYARSRLEEIRFWQPLPGVAAESRARPTYLVQLFLESPNALGPAEEREAEDLYSRVLRVLSR